MSKFFFGGISSEVLDFWVCLYSLPNILGRSGKFRDLLFINIWTIDGIFSFLKSSCLTLGRHGFMLWYFFHLPIQLQSCYIEHICLLVDKTQVPIVAAFPLPVSIQKDLRLHLDALFNSSFFFSPLGCERIGMGSGVYQH